MASANKRPSLSGKRARSRRKRATLRTVNRMEKSTTFECDSDDNNAKCPLLSETGSGSDKSTSQSEDELEDGLVLVCRPTVPNFCSVFLPRGEKSASSILQKAVDCKTFTVRLASFQETCEGYVTYTLEVTTCSQPYHTLQLKRRFSEFVACAAEVNKQLGSGYPVRCFARQEEDEESKAAEDVDKFQWELPAKTWFRVTQTSALEERRAQLERSLETLLLQQDRRMCNLPVVRDFLMLDIFEAQVAEQKNLEAAVFYE